MTEQIALIPAQEYRKRKTTLKLEELPPNEELVGAEPLPAFVSDIGLRGMIEPIIVAEQDKCYWVIDGRRRIKAKRKLDHRTIEATVYSDVPRRVAMSWIAAANNQRSSNPLSDVEAIKYWRNEGITDEKELARLTGLSIQTLRKRMKLLQKGFSSFRTAIKENRLSVGAAEQLAGMNRTYWPRAEQLIKDLKPGKRLTAKAIRGLKAVQVADLIPSLPEMLVPTQEEETLFAVLNGNSLATVYDSYDQALANANGKGLYRLEKMQ